MGISPTLAEPMASADVVVWIVRLMQWLSFWLLGGEPYHQLHLMFLAVFCLRQKFKSWPTLSTKYS